MFIKIMDFIDRIQKRVDSYLSPKRILAIGIAAGILLMLAYLFFCHEIYRDVAGCYSYYAREWGRGNWVSAPIAFLPPLNIFLGGLLVRIGFQGYAAVITVAGLFYILTVFPLYGLLRRFTTDKAAAYGCLFFLLASKIIRGAGMGLLESGRDLFLVLGLYLLFKIKDNPKRWHMAIFFGISMGALCLSRGEGIVFAGALFACLLGCLLYKVKLSWAYILKGPVLLLLVSVIGFLAVTTPRLIENYRNTGYPVLDSRAIDILQKIPGAASFFTDKRAQLWPRENDEFEAASSTKPSLFRQLGKVRKDFFRGAYEVYLFFAVIGIILLLRRRQWRFEYTVLAVVVAVLPPICTFVVSANRYYIYVIPLFMIFTLTGIGGVLQLLDRYRLKGLGFIVLAGLLIGQAVDGLNMVFRDSKEYKFAMWLNAHRGDLNIPENAHPVIFEHQLGEMYYWLDGKRRYEFNEPRESLKTASGFDLFVTCSDENEVLEIARSRKDLKEIDHSFREDYTVFILENKK